MERERVKNREREREGTSTVFHRFLRRFTALLFRTRGTSHAKWLLFDIDSSLRESALKNRRWQIYSWVKKERYTERERGREGKERKRETERKREGEKK